MTPQLPAVRIRSLNTLSRLLGVERGELEALAESADGYYRNFSLDKKDGTARQINAPKGRLKETQRRIHARILRHLELPHFLHGGIPRRSQVSFARQFVGWRHLLRIDIRDFYPSVANRGIFRLWRSLGCVPPVASVLTKLTTKDYSLPQGAHTSPILANLALLATGLDDSLKVSASESGGLYARFMDDIVIGTCGHPKDLVRPAIQSIRERGFSVRRNKILSMSPGQRHQVTGLVVNRQVGERKEYMRGTRAMVHRLSKVKTGTEEHHIVSKSLAGRIAHISSVNKVQAAKIRRYMERLGVTV